MCKSHYVAEFRDDFKIESSKKPAYNPEDLVDFWSFVKKELNLG
jgi:hypothetical protein